MKSSLKPILVTAILGIATAALLLPRVLAEKQRETQAATRQTARAPLAVDVLKVAPAGLRETVPASGSLLANETVEVTAELSGRIVELAFAEGSRVRRGDVLFRINDDELRAQRERTSLRRDLARTQEERLRRLIAERGISQDQLDAAVNERRVLDAELELIDAQLAKAVFRAPFDGVVGLRTISAGAFVTPGTRIATLLSDDPIKIDFAIPEKYAARVKPGLAIAFTLPGEPEPFRGEVYAVDPGIDTDTRTLSLRAKAANPEGRLRPGGFAAIELALDEVPDAILVPTSAIVAGLNRRSVFVHRDGTAVAQPVVTGSRFASEIRILGGLKPGDELIISGMLALRPGLPVTVRKVVDPVPVTAPAAD